MATKVEVSEPMLPFSAKHTIEPVVYLPKTNRVAMLRHQVQEYILSSVTGAVPCDFYETESSGSLPFSRSFSAVASKTDSKPRLLVQRGKQCGFGGQSLLKFKRIWQKNGDANIAKPSVQYKITKLAGQQVASVDWLVDISKSGCRSHESKIPLSPKVVVLCEN
ncbi:hypothetical protein BDR22DRAFT_820762 [Usnea florida]